MSENNSTKKLVSHIPERMKEREWSADTMRTVALRNGMTMSSQTAYRIGKGAANLNMETLEKLCILFDEPIERMISMEIPASELP